MSQKQYDVIGGDGEQYGPYNMDLLEDLVTQGRIDQHSRIREVGTDGDWIPFQNLQSSAVGIPEVTAPDFQVYKETIIADNTRLQIVKAFGDGWSVSMKHFGKILLAVILFMVLLIIPSMIPIIGGFLTIIIEGPLFGGLAILCLNLIRHNTADMGDLFKGFEIAFGKLLLVFLFLTLMSIVLCIPGIIIMIVTFVSEIPPDMDWENEESVDLVFTNFLTNPMLYIGYFTLLLFSSISYLLFYFAMPLIADKRYGVIDSLSISFRVSLRNLFRFMLFYVVLTLIIIISMIPLGLGLIISIPWVTISMYQAYEQLFSPEMQPNEH